MDWFPNPLPRDPDALKILADQYERYDVATMLARALRRAAENEIVAKLQSNQIRTQQDALACQDGEICDLRLRLDRHAQCMANQESMIRRLLAALEEARNAQQYKAAELEPTASGSACSIVINLSGEGGEDPALEKGSALDVLEDAWGVIANVGWETQSHVWRLAAERVRDAYHKLIKETNVEGAPKT